jgi:SAM-dependent methyltransferase
MLDEGAQIIADCLARSGKTINDLLLYGDSRAIMQQLNVKTLLCADLIQECEADICYEEGDQRFEKNTFDVIASNMSLQFVNDIGAALAQYNMALRDDGYFIATLIGGRSMQELRTVFAYADQEIYGGMMCRVMPTIQPTAVVALMQRYFHNPVVHVETIDVHYDDFWKLLRDLRDMRCSNFLAHRQQSMTSNALFRRAEELYWQHFSDNDQLVATFELLVVSAFKNGH